MAHPSAYNKRNDPMSTKVLLAGVLALAACSSSALPGTAPVRGGAQLAQDPRLGAVTDRICFTSSIDGFGATTRDTVVVNEGRDDYLLEIFGSCLPLRSAQQIAFPERAGCLRKGDRLIVSENISGLGHGNDAGRTQACTVKSIYKWDPKAKAAAPATPVEGG
jgi:Family of unknown function (DUF6491)